MSSTKAMKISENEFVIASRVDTAILMDCEDIEGLKYINLPEGNHVLNTKSNLVKH